MAELTPVEAIATHFAQTHRLPEWMQIPALGWDMTPLGELAVEGLLEAGFAIVRRDEVP